MLRKTQFPANLLVSALALVLSGCQPSDTPPARGDYTLTWYPRTGTDYGTVVPGFRSLEMCRRAGVSMTMERFFDPVYGSRREVDEPWFECGNGCRPFPGTASILRVCQQIREYRGAETRERVPLTPQ